MPGGNSTTESKKASDRQKFRLPVATYGDILRGSAKIVIVLAAISRTTGPREQLERCLLLTYCPKNIRNHFSSVLINRPRDDLIFTLNNNHP